MIKSWHLHKSDHKFDITINGVNANGIDAEIQIDNDKTVEIDEIKGNIIKFKWYVRIADTSYLGVRFNDFEGQEEKFAELTNYYNSLKDKQKELHDAEYNAILSGKKPLDYHHEEGEHCSGYSKMSVAEFNNKLKTLYAAIPRRIDNLSKILAKRKLDFNDIIADEQELFDVMVNRVRNAHDLGNCSVRPTVLEAFHLDWRDVTEEEQDKVLSMLKGNASQYIKAWRIHNRSTEERFDRFCQQEQLSEGHGIDHLFHGSRTENFWSIVTNGLLINPDCGVQRSGSMFGNGTYFAPLAQKSLGYTDGGYWTGGNADVRFLAIYRVATGKHYDIYHGSDSSLTKTVLQKKCPGAHCTWAHGRGTGGTTLLNDEVIVYDEAQSTIEYLIMMK